MRWLAVFLFMSSPVFANSATTTNVLPNLSTFTTSGSTTSNSTSGCTAGQFCTGNASAGGGTYTSTFDVPLTEAEVKRGFDLNSAVTVNSHVSNSRLATCTSVTQAGDCRDLFTLGITLLDGDAVAKKFTHEVELDFTGNRLFSFSDSIAANSFGILTGSFSLFGIDAGFHSGFYGPKFSDPSLTFTYEQIVEQQIIDQIAQNDLIAAAPPVQIVVAPPAVDLPPPPTAAPIVVALAPTAPSEPPPPPEIAPIQIDLPPPPMEQQQQEAQAEATIEAQIEQDIEPPAPEPTAEPEPEPEPTSEPEPEPVAEPEPEPEPTAEPEPTSEPEPEPEPVAERPAETREAQAPAKPKSRQEKVKAAAEKAVAKIAPSQRYSAASQTTTMVAMGMISPKIVAPRSLVDTPGFFTGTKVPDGPSLVDRMQNYTLFGRSNGAHNALVELDWRR
tara:strand:+ start:3331 stop:4665 length:1335 start_codon:yes stop_codon:yes gene_type:complete